MPPLFSIIIPAHNEEKYLPSTLDSIQRQSFRDYEVIVVANGCTDKTDQAIAQQTNPNVKLFSLKQANVSRARNHGASQATGDILVFLDADTQFESTTLQTIHQQFTSPYIMATTKVKPDSKHLKHNLAMGFKNFYLQTGLHKGCSGAFICRRENFDKVNGYDASIVIGEHRQLIQKLQPLGKYICLDTYVTTSMRRWEQWGLWRMMTFWTTQWLKNKIGRLNETSYEKIR